MNVIIDLAAVLIILAAVIIGAKRGFIKSVLVTFRLVASVVLAVLLKPLFFALYDKLGLLAKIKGSLYKSAEKICSGMTATVSGKEVLAKMGLPEAVAEKATLKIDLTGEASEICEKISTSVAKFCVSAIAILTGFIICLLIFCFVIKMADVIKKIPVLGGIDRFGGAVVGILVAYVIIHLSALLVYTLASVGCLTGFAKALDGTVIVRFIYKLNLVSLVLWK